MNESINNTVEHNEISLSFLAQVIAFGTPLLIIVGIAYKAGFYLNPSLDALWILSVFSPTEFMISSSLLLVSYGVALLYICYIYSKSNPHKEMVFQLIFLIVLSFSMTYVHGSPTWQGMIIAVNFIGFYFIISKSINIKTFGFALLLVSAFCLGRFDLENTNVKSLPVVLLKEPIGEDVWHLIDSTPEKMILISLNDPYIKKFKIIDHSDIESIYTPR